MGDEIQYPIFRFEKFNERRLARGVEAAQFYVVFDENDGEFLWMSQSDIVKNLKLFPSAADELVKGLAKYPD